MILKFLECDILKYRKPLSEFWKVAFCFAPKTKFRKFIFGIYERRILVASEDEIPIVRNRFSIFRI